MVMELLYSWLPRNIGIKQLQLSLEELTQDLTCTTKYRRGVFRKLLDLKNSWRHLGITKCADLAFYVFKPETSDLKSRGSQGAWQWILLRLRDGQVMSFLASRSTNAGCGVHTLLAASLGKGCTVRKASVLRTTYSLSFLDKVRTWQLEMFWDRCETSCTGESCSILLHPSNGRCWRLLIRRPTFPIAHSSRNTAYFPQLIVTKVVLCCCS